jgi:serine/threonine protein kinase
VDEDSHRWNRITPSGFAWEREALDYMRERLPDREPYRAWANFEFITHTGRVREIDLAVLTPGGFFLVEIKSRPGEITGDAGTWTWRWNGRNRVDDNPLKLTDTKSKELRSLLSGTPAGRKLRRAFPFVQPAVFLSAPGLRVRLPDGPARAGLYGRGGKPAGEGGDLPGVMALLGGGDGQPTGAPPRVTVAIAEQVAKAMDEAGIRPSQRSKRAGDYELVRRLDDGPGFQDFEAKHVQLANVRKRVRIYPYARGASDEARAGLQRAAEREYQVLQSLRHSGVLRAEYLTSHDLGPAVVFERDQAEVRLDHWLVEHGDRLTIDQRLGLVRQLADVLRYAHSHRVAHRALSPQVVLVWGSPEAPELKVCSWQTAGRAGEGGGTRASVLASSGATRLEALVDEAMTVYMAPEALHAAHPDGVLLDVFALGALAYTILAGHPPAENGMALQERLRDEPGGLQLAASVDGVGEPLRKLVAQATSPAVAARYDSVAWFLLDLDEAERALAAGDTTDETRHPDDARPGDVVGGFEVVRKLGKGSTAVALLVRDGEGHERVLKVALDERADARIDDEADVLDTLTDRTIVKSFARVEVGGRLALLLAKAGDKTLARVLRDEGTISLDLLERWGDDLLAAVGFLEQMGVAHRDIKPDNLGVVPVGKDEVLHLVLFDFSLSRAPVTDITAGTPPYLDPFLSERPAKRWDVAAERFAAAVTLYEMATGVGPCWGDGQSHPAVVDGEATIEVERLPAPAREALAGFFERALRRDPAERYDTADDMRAAWHRALSHVDRPTVSTTSHDEPPDYDLLATNLEPASSLAELGLSGRALDALERLNVVTLADLLALPVGAINSARGVSNRVRREVLQVRGVLRRHFPDVATGRARDGAAATGPGGGTRRTTAADDAEGRSTRWRAGAPDDSEPGDVQSLEDLVGQLVPAQRRRDSRDAEAVRLLLRLDDRAADGWPPQTALAGAMRLTAARISQMVVRARDRWRRLPSVTRLRDELATLLDNQGGVMTGEELAEAIASLRGVADPDGAAALLPVPGEPAGGTGATGPDRRPGDGRHGPGPDLVTRLGLAALRAASEVESAREQPRWVVRRHASGVVVACDGGAVAGAALTDWAVRLGAAADALVADDPLPAPAPALARLREVTPPEGADELPDPRLIRLAAAASTSAVVSPRLELYPRGLDPERALRLGQNALLVPAAASGGRPGMALAPADIDRRIRARYPEMAPLPDRPALDDLLAAVSSPLRWDDTAGGYGVPALHPAGLTSTATPSLGRLATTTAQPELPPDDEAVATETRLEQAMTTGGFLALAVTPPRAEAAAAALARFGPQRVSVEARLLARMHEVAAELDVDWAVVIAADAAAPGTTDWGLLLQLMHRVWPLVDADVRAAGPHVLLTELGPLARYDAMGWLERWRDATLDPASGLRAVWALLPGDARRRAPTIDDVVVPTMGDSQWTRLPDRWIANVHRSHSDSPAPETTPVEHPR